MEISYTGLDGQLYREALTPIVPVGPILHATPTKSIESILRSGLLLDQPPVKLMVDVKAIFCTIPSQKASTKDLFRSYPDWSVVVLDANAIPQHQWYFDFLAIDDPSHHGENQHILTLENIPPDAIIQVIDLSNQ